jgi:signal transduction histidine kinase
MTLNRLKALVVLSAAGFFAVLESSRYALSPMLESWRGRLLYSGVVLLAMLLFSLAVFKVFEGIQERLARRGNELLALHDASLAITAELARETVLQRVVETARQLVGARYGALAIYREDGSIDSFFTSGLAPGVHQAIGDLPHGRGLLGLVLEKGEHLRLDDLSQHPASCGFPPNHPPMKSLLAVPITGGGPYRGNLYLSEKAGAAGFGEEDEETLVRFATQAAIAVANAYLHHQVRGLAAAEERLRIAHEMHDGLAQVLAYVNTKGQAVREFLRAGRTDEAAVHLDQLAAAARDVYGDVRESILGLRSSSDPAKSLAETLLEYVESWRDRSGVTIEAAIDDDLAVPQATELQLVRVVQEALGNVRKHAQARHARVEVGRRGKEVSVLVEDDGVGFEPGAPRRGEFPRFGLATMRERAESVGGTMAVESQPGRGTRILVRFPAGAGTPRPREGA